MTLKLISHDLDIIHYDLESLTPEQLCEFACHGLISDYSEFLEYATTIRAKNLPFVDYLETLKGKAVSCTNIDDFQNLNWRYVAARIFLTRIYYESSNLRASLNISDSYYDFVTRAVELGIYDKKITQVYKKEDFDFMQKEMNTDYNLGFDYAGLNMLFRRYLMKYKGIVFERPNEMFLSLAMLLAAPEKEENRLKIAKDIYHAIAQRKLSLATPIVLNLRRPKGNLASCFITAIDDDLNSIYYSIDQIAQISKFGGGVGVNISRIRSHGAYIQKSKGASHGVLPWVKVINDTAIAVNQLGSRAGAVTIALDIWHRDIEEFLEVQSENGDQRKKSYDIFPQVVINDLFMRRVEDNKTWTMFDPHELRQKHGIEMSELWGEEFEKTYLSLENDSSLEFRSTANARDMFKKLLRTTVETGLPYVFYKDTANRLNPNKHCGYIGNANLCTESFSNFKPSKVNDKELSADGLSVSQKIETGEVHTCNLTSLVLSNITSDEDLENMTKLAILVLDNAIEITRTPIPEATFHNKEYRILGLGVMGYADYIAKRGILYDESSEFADKLFEKIAYYSAEKSCDLAKERGVYPKYSGSDWDKGNLYGHDEEWFNQNSSMPENWNVLRDKIKEFGMRNGGLVSVAPNTSTSLLMGCTASVLPVYKKFFMDKGEKGVVPNAPPFLNSQTFWYYKENQNIDQRKVVDVISKMQKWVDQGISMEIILNIKQGLRAKDLYDIYVDAWKKGCKTVYYVRSINLDAESKKEDCVSCSG